MTATLSCTGYADLSGAECAAQSSERIHEALEGTPEVSIPCATVTYVRVEHGDSDPAGFFVQAEASGPALYIQISSEQMEADFGFAPREGDLIGFQIAGAIETVDEIRRVVYHLREVSHLGTSPTPPDQLVTNHTSNPDLYDNRREHDFTLAFSSGQIGSFFGSSGAPFEGANFNVFEDQGEPEGLVSVKVRLPRDYIDKYGVVGWCLLDMGPTPLWPKAGETGDRLHFTGWRDEQVQIHNCPNANIQVLLAMDGWIELRLLAKDFGDLPLTNASRWWHPEVADPGLFRVNGITPSQLVNQGEMLRLEVPDLPDSPTLSVTTTGRVEDILGHEVLPE